jgi:nitrogen regulatory protein PII 1
MMTMVRAIIRPEKAGQILSELADAGFPAVTKIDVVGRGKQRGVKVGNLHYDEIPKELLLMVVKEEEKDDVIRIIMKNARTGEKGTFGDGKIFVSDVEEVYTISSGETVFKKEMAEV